MAAIQTTTAPLMTAEELFQLPDDGCRYELVEGGLIRMPPAGGEHGAVTMNVGFLLRACLQTGNAGKLSR